MAKGGSASGKIVGISVAALIFASLGWTAISTLAEVNVTGVDPMVVDIGIGLVSLILGIAVVILFLKEVGVNL